MQRSNTFSTKKIWVLNIHIVISSYMFLYTMGVFNPCTDSVAASLNWGPNKDLYVTLFSAFVPVGALVGTIITGYLIDRFGRRKTTMMTDVAYVIGTIILVMPSTPTFAIGRLITGLGAGIFMTIGPIYVTEVTPEALIAKVGPIIVVANNLGLLTAYGLSTTGGCSCSCSPGRSAATSSATSSSSTFMIPLSFTWAKEWSRKPEWPSAFAILMRACREG
jgi:MFS family permease